MDEAAQPALYRAFLLLVYSNLWVAAAIASLVPFVQLTLGLALDWRPVALIFTSALVPYLLDRVVDVYVQEIPDQRAQAFFQQPSSLLLLAGAAMVTAGLIYAAPTAVQRVSLGGLVPLLYGLPLFPGFGVHRNSDGERDDSDCSDGERHHGLRWYRLKDIPGSKAWIVCGVITYALVAVPMAYGGRSPSASTWTLSLFLLVFLGSNSHVFDIRDIESDQKKGVKTMPVLLGVTPTRWLWTGLNLGMVLVLVGIAGRGGPTPPLMVVLPCMAATVSYLWWVTADTPRNRYNIWIDGALFLPLILTLLRLIA